MNNISSLLLAIADQTLPDGRETLVRDLADELAKLKFLTIEEVAERYSVSIPAVREWMRTGKIRASFKVGQGTTRFTLADIYDFERSNTRSENAN